MSVDTHSPVPIYEQIAEYIRGGVATGIYRTGEIIPSMRALALELVVNPNTVQRAYETLEREGIVEGRKGVGMIVRDGSAAAARVHSEATVQATFARGVRAARGLNMPVERIRDSFEQALCDGAAEQWPAGDRQVGQRDAPDVRRPPSASSAPSAGSLPSAAEDNSP